MSTAVAIRPALGAQNLQSLEELQTLGSVFAKSGFFADTKDAAQAIVKVMAGRELGFPPIASMTGVYIVKGKVSLSANLMAAAVKRSGKYNFKVRELTPELCRIEFFESGESIGLSEFTRADAQKAGTQNMDKFARNMLYARAMSNGCRWYCPDIFGGPVYTPEEMGATVNEDGEVIDTELVRLQQPQPQPQAQIAKGDSGKLQSPTDPRRELLKEMIAELKTNGITKEQVETRISELCDGTTAWNKLSPGDIEGLIEDFSRWLDTFVIETES